jgi:hypothetical protein
MTNKGLGRLYINCYFLYINCYFALIRQANEVVSDERTADPCASLRDDKQKEAVECTQKEDEFQTDETLFSCCISGSVAEFVGESIICRVGSV